MTAALLPREHGAYGQITFPLLAALLGAGVSTSGLLMTAATVAGFLGHEPAAVLLGLRGARSKRDLARRATRWLGCAVTLGLAAGIGALLTMPSQVRWSLLGTVARFRGFRRSFRQHGSGQLSDFLRELAPRAGLVDSNQQPVRLTGST